MAKKKQSIEFAEDEVPQEAIQTVPKSEVQRLIDEAVKAALANFAPPVTPQEKPVKKFHQPQ